jgi:hypothetical protein
MAKTRSCAEVWLIGKGIEKLSGSHLPTNGDVLRLMMFFHIDKKSPLKEAAASVISKVFEIWERARIPHQRIDSGLRILMKLFGDYEKLKKNRKRNNDRDRGNQEEFKSHIHCLFDVARSDALTTMKIEEDKQFLIMQRNDVLSCTMAGVDVVLDSKEKRKRIREERFSKFAVKVQSDNLVDSTSSTSNICNSSSSCTSCSSDSDDEFKVRHRSSSIKSQPKQARVNILADPDVAGALDRVNVPDRGN